MVGGEVLHEVRPLRCDRVHDPGGEDAEARDDPHRAEGVEQRVRDGVLGGGGNNSVDKEMPPRIGTSKSLDILC